MLQINYTSIKNTLINKATHDILGKNQNGQKLIELCNIVVSSTSMRFYILYIHRHIHVHNYYMSYKGT